MRHKVIYYILYLLVGLCLYLVKRLSLVNGYNCTRFRYGCPKSSYLSTNIFERKYVINHQDIDKYIKKVFKMQDDAFIYIASS